MFFFFFLVNWVVVYIANRLFPANVVLGTYFHTLAMALIYSMAVLTMMTTGAAPVIEFCGCLGNGSASGFLGFRSQLLEGGGCFGDYPCSLSEAGN